MNFRSALRVCLSLLVVSVIATAISASAQSSSIGPNLPPGLTSYGYSVAQDPYAPSETAWFFGTADSPISFYYDPQAGAWQKILTGAGDLDQYQEVNILEYVKIGSGESWTDWHEAVTTPDFILDTDHDDSFYTIDGGVQQYTGITFGPGDTSLSIVFPSALPVGTVILIHKELEYRGEDTFNNDQNAITVNQYASVPEPSTWALMGIGLAGFVLRRRRG